MKEIDRVEPRQMSGIDDARSNTQIDVQAEQQDKLIPPCPFCLSNARFSKGNSQLPTDILMIH